MNIFKVGILYHPRLTAALEKAREVEKIINQSGGSAWLCSAWDTAEARAELDGTRLIITIGGDGTILRAAQVVIPEDIPMLGINMGRLGFMTELALNEVAEKMPLVLAGQGWIDDRAMLRAEIPLADGKTGVFHALNDITVARGPICRLINVEVSIGAEFFTTYRTDGVVIGTATGSTGYSLSGGGPVLYPGSHDFTLVPLVPHLGLPFPLVLASTSEVTLRITGDQEATASVDGHINLPLSGGAVIKVKPSDYQVSFLRVHEPCFYSSLEQKLKGTRNNDSTKS